MGIENYYFKDKNIILLREKFNEVSGEWCVSDEKIIKTLLDKKLIKKLLSTLHSNGS